MKTIRLLFLLLLIFSPLTHALEKASFLGIEYVTGGVGIGELKTLNEQAQDYSLKVLTAEKDKYLSGVDIIILNDTGSLILQTTMDGPFLYVKLPEGNYTIQASGYGENFERRISIKENQQLKVIFRWK